MEEPYFLVNEFLLKDLDALKDVAAAVKKKPDDYIDRAVFLKDFTNTLFRVYVIQKDRLQREAELLKLEEEKNKEAEEQKIFAEKERLRLELQQKRQELVNRMQEMKKNEARLSALSNFKDIIDSPSLVVPVPGRKDLVFSKVTKSVLVYVLVNEKTYTLFEPVLAENEFKILTALEKKVDASLLTDNESVQNVIKEEAKLAGVTPTDIFGDLMRYYLVRNKVRFGKISPMLEDTDVQEALCDGVGKPVHILLDGKELVTNVVFNTPEELNEFIRHLASLTGNLVSTDNPFLNAVFDGFTIQATLGTEFVSGKFVIVR